MNADRAIAPVDVLIPTFRRWSALAVTLTSLLAQRTLPQRVVVSDQTDGMANFDHQEVQSVLTLLELCGVAVEVHHHLPRRGMAEHREFLLMQARAPYALSLDDDVFLEPHVLERLLRAIRREHCGFVGAFVNAPSAVNSAKPIDRLPPDLGIELWEGAVEPERVVPDGHGWDRRRLHFAAYAYELWLRVGIDLERERLYKVAWVGGCVLYDVGMLRDVGGYDFWPDLPEQHCGEDVLVQLRLMARFGGAGLAPSGAWHLEVPTTCSERRFDAPRLLPVDVARAISD